MVKTKAVAKLQRVGILVSQGTAVADVILQIGGGPTPLSYDQQPYRGF